MYWIIFDSVTKEFDQRELEYNLIHDGCHNLLKLGEGTSRKAIFYSYRGAMKVNTGMDSRGHVGHLNDVKCQKRSRCVCFVTQARGGHF